MRTKSKSNAVHAASMVYRYRKSYLMLMITIVFSFSILLGYMVLNDSKFYNRYKHVFSAPDNAVILETQNKSHVNLLLSAASRIDPSSKAYTYLVGHAKLSQYSEKVSLNVQLIPNTAKPLMISETVSDGLGELMETVDWIHEVKPIDGELTLNDNQAFVTESFYQMVLHGANLPVPLRVPIQLTDDCFYMLDLSVVGVCPDTEFSIVKFDDEGISINGCLYCNMTLVPSEIIEKLEFPDYMIVLETSKPEAICRIQNQMGEVYHSTYYERKNALSQKRENAEQRLWIAMLLYVLLGVNLFGSFENALSDRKFEIGVKRAIGASKYRIIFQFLIEGIIVMAIGILLSICVVSAIMSGFKLYLLVKDALEWTIYISRSSAMIFAVCSVSMTVLFSLMFACRATRVEIVKYIKGE